MPGPAKVILVEADPAANAALRFGLSRAGLEVATASNPSAVAEVAGSAGLVLISDGRNGANGSGGEGSEGSDGRVIVGGAELVEAVRSSLEDASLSTPILFVDGVKLEASEGRGEEGAKEGPSDAQRSSRRAAERAGAWEVLQGPQALRDIANVARIMLCDRRNEGWAGNLIEISGVFGLVRALSALGRSGVLTLTRGVRRGEVRYFHGEITSAQVGMIHGQAAFHQLLLWTDAKFDFRGEIIVRRRQIPLTPQELLADAERFLESTRDIAGGLSPSVVLDVVADKLTALAIKIPPEVHAILNMFDGRRNLVDVLEDSPYRVHDTLRVARKGFETKVLKAVPPHKARPNWKAVASLERWLLGEQPVVPREVRSTGVVTGIDEGETIKMAPELSGGVRASGVASGTVAAIAAAAGVGYDVDVTERTPARDSNGSEVVAVAVTVSSWRDLSALDWSELVPRSSGLEIPMLSPVVPAAKTEGEINAVEVGDLALTQAQQSNGRSVIVSEDAIISPEERAEEDRKIEARKRAEQVAMEADRKRVEAEIAAAAEKKKAEAAAAAEKAVAEQEAAEKAAAEQAAAEAAEKAAAEAAEKAAAEAAEKAAAEKAAAEKAAAEAAEKAAAEKTAAEAAEKVAAEQAAAEKAAAEAAEQAAAEKAAAEAAEKAAAEKAAAEKAAAAAAEKAAAEKAAAEATEKAAAEKHAAERAAAEAAEQAAAEKLAAERAAAEAAAAEKLAAERAAAEVAEKAAAEKIAAEKAAVEKAAAETAAAEKAAIEKAAAEKASEEQPTARLPPMSQTDEKTSKINRRPTTADVLPKNSKKRDRKKGGRPGTESGGSSASLSASPTASDGPAVGAAPRESQQDLSQTAKLGPQATAANPLTKHPRPSSSPVLGEEPSVLVADLKAAHSAVSALAKAQAAAASSPDAGGNFDAVVQQVKTDASKATAAFTADEEAFFQAGGHASNVETFADLDAGYRPRTFWQRLLGRGKTNH